MQITDIRLPIHARAAETPLRRPETSYALRPDTPYEPVSVNPVRRDQPLPKGHGAMTQGYFKTQIAQLEAGVAWLTKAEAERPGFLEGPMGAMLADNQRSIAQYAKAMATAPKGPGDFVIWA